jgi:hypothetical protein
MWCILISLTTSPSGTNHDTHMIRKPILFFLPAAQDSEVSILLATHTKGVRERPLW